MFTHLIQGHDTFGPPERQDELRSVWKRNEGLFDVYTCPEGRPTFTELFAMCKPSHINVITNSDIYFEPLVHFPPEGTVWALSRYDIDAAGNATLWNHLDSQDTYIINGGPHIIDASTVEVRTDGETEIRTVPFTQGIAGCDNRLLHVLRKAGFTVTNPSKTIRTFHLHLNDYRSYVDGARGDGRGVKKIDRIQPPYAFCAPAEL